MQRDVQKLTNRGSVMIGIASGLLLVSGIFVVGYFVQVQSAVADNPMSAASVELEAASADIVDATRRAAAEATSRQIELQFDGKSRMMKWADLGATVDEAAVASEASRLSKAGITASAITFVGDDISGVVPIHIDREVARQVLVKLKAELDRAPTNARMDLEARKIEKEAAGYGIDVYGAITSLEAAARSGAVEVVLDGGEIPPTVTVKDLGIDDISTVLSSFTTKFSVAEKSRNDNLKLVASHLDGFVMQPNKPFSFNDIVGDRTEKEGYKMAHVITAGQMVDGMAGGACQISTTLHGAAFFAGLDIPSATPHSRPSTYVAMGLDATVVYPQVDLRLENKHDFPVVIHYRVARGEATVEILGKSKPFDKIEFKRSITKRIPFETVTREDQKIGMGHMVVDQPGYPGYKVIRRRNIYKDGEIIKSDKWNINYRPVIEYVRMGINPDPNMLAPKKRKHHAPKPAHGTFTMVR